MSGSDSDFSEERSRKHHHRKHRGGCGRCGGFNSCACNSTGWNGFNGICCPTGITGTYSPSCCNSCGNTQNCCCGGSDGSWDGHARRHKRHRKHKKSRDHSVKLLEHQVERDKKALERAEAKLAKKLAKK